MPTKATSPKGWNEVLLDALTKRGSGHTPDKKKPEYWNGPIKWISLADSSKLDNLYIDNTKTSTTEEGLKNSSAVLHPAGTVVMTRDAGVGKSAIMKEPMACSQHFMAWRCEDNLNNFFLYHWLQTKKREFENVASGNTIKTIGLPYFKKLKIIAPPIEEQEKIVEVLKTWDNTLETFSKKIKLKKKIKKGLMQQLLTGKRRLPEFNGEWKTLKINEIGTNFSGLRGKSGDDFGNGEPYIAYMNIFSSCGIIKTPKSKVMISVGEKQNKVKYGDILFTTSSETPDEVGMSSVYLINSTTDVYLNSFCFGFRLHNFDTLLPDFAQFYFRSQSFRKQMTRIAQGMSRYNLSLKYFLQTEIYIPENLEEQTAIATILTTADEEIEALKKKKKIIKQQKKFLLNNLMTGNIRLPEFTHQS